MDKMWHTVNLLVEINRFKFRVFEDQDQDYGAQADLQLTHWWNVYIWIPTFPKGISAIF